ncbi:mechanosensitive ion channel family protein [Flavobacterium sp.]|jgi:small conductance mechanosensitive channel|uniref:mechanosensitive ion channel family protein n=1 Tax=Flavobacterium sp. TaxID=239 RepID=UPI0037C061D4
MKAYIRNVISSKYFQDNIQPYITNIVIGVTVFLLAHIFATYCYNLIISAGINNQKAKNIHSAKHMNLAYNVVAHITYYTIMIVGILILMRIYGIETTSVIALFGASGIAVGLALQGTLSDLFSGILQAINQKINIDDVIELDGRLMRVIEFTLLYTTVQDTKTFAIIKIPNHMFETNLFLNYSLMEKGFAYINIAVSNDKNKVEYEKIFNIIRDVVKQNKNVVQEEPSIFVNDMGKGFTNVVAKVPIYTKTLPDIFTDLNTAIRIALQKNDVQLASYREAFVVK